MEFEKKSKKIGKLQRCFLPAALFALGYVALLAGWVPGHLAALVVICMGLMALPYGGNVLHEAAHGTLFANPRWSALGQRLLDVCGVSHFVYVQRHLDAHHVAPNQHGVDPDIISGRLLRLSPDSKRRPCHRYQWIYAWALYAVYLPYWVLVLDPWHYATGSVGGAFGHHLKGRTVWTTVEFIAFKLIYVAWTLVLPAYFSSLGKALAAYAVFYLIASLTSTSLLQAAHIFDGTAYRSARAPAASFSDRQMQATCDFSHESRWLTAYYGFLNHQASHHYAPGVPCGELPKIAADLAATNGSYKHFARLADALASHARQLRILGLPEKAS